MMGVDAPMVPRAVTSRTHHVSRDSVGLIYLRRRGVCCCTRGGGRKLASELG